MTGNLATMAYTVLFAELNQYDGLRAGGKGASLGELTQAGIPVPPGFVICTDAFATFLHTAELTEEIQGTLDGVNHHDLETVERASERIAGLIMHASLPEDLQVSITQSFCDLGAPLVAVRSSATAEDGADASWAGELESYLNTTEQTLLENVKRCWASLFTPRAIFYRFERGFHTKQVSVAVVVQKMVQADTAGIAFSVHPVTEDPNQLIIEAGFGLGEAVVSGSITPDSYVVSKEPREIIDVYISDQERGLYRKAEGGVEWHELGERGSTQVLEGPSIMQLAELVLTIEQHYGFPCDIEWAQEQGIFYIVQSRPITTLNA